MSEGRPRVPESRFDELREEARRAGGAPGYHGRPILKRPVWTWEIPVYFFLGGLAGTAAAVGAAALWLDGATALARDAFLLAAGGALLSPLLLVMDLGRPHRFLNMLRVVKFGSPMSVGVWTLVLFTPAALAAAAGLYFGRPGIAAIAAGPAALLGLLLATYTGVLIGATVIPAWNAHRSLLPFHFGMAGLGSAVAALELLGHRAAALHALGIAVAAAETLVFAALEITRRRTHPKQRALVLRAVAATLGPVSLLLRLAAPRPAAAAVFLAAALLSRILVLRSPTQT